MDRLKSFVKRIPGAVYTVRKFRTFLTSRAAGSLQGGDWIYDRHVVGWLCNPSSRKQLPPPYRLFAIYAAFQHFLGAQRVIGGKYLLKSIISIRKLLRVKDHTELKVGPYTAFVHLDDPRMLQIPNELSEDNADTSVLKRFIAKGDTFVDVGANHGSFSIVASKLVGPEGLVIAIEPQGRLAGLVEKSLAANGPCKYQVHSVACGDWTGTVDFYIPTGSSGGAGVFSEFSAVPSHRKVAVPMRRFDEAIDWNNFPGRVFVKLDVEGSEMNFLRGAAEMIRARKPPILLEINRDSMEAAGETGEALLGCLRDLGYQRVFEVRPFRGPDPLSSLNVPRRGVRNVIVTARSALLKIFTFICLTEADEALTLLSIVPFWILS